MKLDVPDDYLTLVVTALEHHYAYTQAARREDSKYQEAADWIKGNSAQRLGWIETRMKRDGQE